jgi:hypothetical protein
MRERVCVCDSERDRQRQRERQRDDKIVISEKKMCEAKMFPKTRLANLSRKLISASVFVLLY